MKAADGFATLGATIPADPAPERVGLPDEHPLYPCNNDESQAAVDPGAFRARFPFGENRSAVRNRQTARFVYGGRNGRFFVYGAKW